MVVEMMVIGVDDLIVAVVEVVLVMFGKLESYWKNCSAAVVLLDQALFTHATCTCPEKLSSQCDLRP